jgi:hypothetical protein
MPGETEPNVFRIKAGCDELRVGMSIFIVQIAGNVLPLTGSVAGVVL